ncbi:glycosyltransferase family 22 protein [Amylostereum chailletii]|nr:glycosyltransferase family 22 protein [Amylostereum chailletii]
MPPRTTALALSVRVLLALATRTFFQPDEFFQSLEPAHRIVFGYGNLTWEWLAPNPIRSIVYPALNLPVYWALKTLGLDGTELLILAPKVLHGALAAGTDIWIREVARGVLGERYVSTAYFLSLTSFFHGLSLSRSLSNSLETTLTTIALSHFPWDPARALSRSHLRRMLIFAALACSVRTTNAVLWIYLVPVLLWRLRAHRRHLVAVILDASFIGLCALLSLFALDTAYYGTPTLTPLAFLLTNASPVSLFYGTSPWHYYLTQALPLLCGPALPFVLHGISKPQSARSRTALGLVLWTTCVYSLAGHKEWRFLRPLLPLLHLFAAKSLVDAFHAPPAPPLAPARRPRLPIRKPHLLLLLLSLPPIAYTALSHAHAQLSVLRYLRALPATDLRSLGFLMPCHSTPGQSHLHRPLGEGRVWALGCEPPLGLRGDALNAYRDQTDVFYASPAAYLAAHFPPRVDARFPPSPRPTTPPGTVLSAADAAWAHAWPSHLVFFGALLRDDGGADVRPRLEGLGYREVWAAGSGLEEDRRRRGGVRVWKYDAALDRG